MVGYFDLCPVYLGGFFSILNDWFFFSFLTAWVLYPDWLILLVCILNGWGFYSILIVLLLVCILNGWGFFSILMVNFFVLYPDWLGFFLYPHG